MDLCIPTRARPDELGRCVRSFAANADRHGHALRFVIADDSDPDRAAQNRALVQEALIGSAHGVLHLGAPEKRALAEALARESGVARELCELAVLDAEACEVRTGANRNALLLACAGARFIAVDDDVVAAFGSAEAAPRGAAGGGDTTDFRFFASPEDTLLRVRQRDVDAVSLLTRDLGRAVAPSRRIAVTRPGLFGDSGASSPFGLLLFPAPSLRATLAASADDYRSAMASRQLLRLAARPMATPMLGLMGYALGVDATQPLPPFLTVMRNQDGVWGATLSLTCPELLSLHLPLAIRHAPPPRPAGRPPIDAWWSLRLSDVMIGFVQAASAAVGREPDPPGRLRAFGRWLAERAGGSAGELGEVIRDVAEVYFWRARLGMLAQVTRDWRDAPDHVRADLAELRVTGEALAQRSTGVPADLRAAFGAGAEAATQRVIQRHAALLQSWSALFEAAAKVGWADRCTG
jgi:hypothetical protein